MKKFLFGKEENAYKSSFFWTMMSSSINAFFSVFALIVITRTLDMAAAGVFSIAYAVANLILFLAKGGIRNFQVTDHREQFSFNTYYSLRLTFMGLSIVAAILYSAYVLFFGGYSPEKTAVVFLMCLLKLIEGIEDVFLARYQQSGRLDVANKIFTLRLGFMSLMFIVLLIVLKNLMLATGITFVASSVLSYLLFSATFLFFIKEPLSYQKEGQWALFVRTYPLLIQSFLSLYLINAPKFAIDKLLSEEAQGYYNIVAMPVFVITLFSTFVYQPILAGLSADWAQKKIKKVVFSLLNQVVLYVIFTVVCVAGAYFLGVPVFNLIYNCDIAPYKLDLLILLSGGLLQAFANLLVSALTIIRHQKAIMWCYIVASAFAFFASTPLVRLFMDKGESLVLRGASLSCILTLTILFVLLLTLCIFGFIKEKNKLHTTE